MSNDTQAGQTPANVARIATQDRVLERGHTGLIGLFGPPGKLSALVRDASGKIRRLKIGDRLNRGRVMAIDKDGVMIERNGRSLRMTLPSG
ncbi:hypothetical protein I5535_05945 [Rhodobacteraceae bacterium F11138]|nr:hypothetical protein [Rhodobacteraceae bacterium F11138]